MPLAHHNRPLRKRPANQWIIIHLSKVLNGKPQCRLAASAAPPADNNLPGERDRYFDAAQAFLQPSDQRFP